MSNAQAMPSILDREVDVIDQDAFGHRHFAMALQGLVESDSNQPPYSVGLLGRWGTGKSTIKNLYIRSISDDLRKLPNGATRRDTIHVVTFNAWRFGGENIKRALLRHVFLTLGGDEQAIADALFHQVTRQVPTKRAFKDLIADFYERYVWNFLPTLSAAVIIVVAALVIHSMFSLTDDWAIAFLMGSIAYSVGIITRAVSDPARFSVPRSTNITRVELPRISAEQYEDLLIKQIHHYKTRGDGKKCERLVIFIDDLDRLSAEEMVSGLDAVRTFMEISLPCGMGVIFVISCDEDRVADALGDRSKRKASSDLPGAVFNRTDARRYLDRIFQFRLEIPPPPKRDMRQFATSRLNSQLPHIVRELEKHGAPVDTVISTLVHVGVQSPRNAIQSLNAFGQAWWLGTLRERDGAGTDRPGGLREGAITKHAVALAAVCALRVDFPDFFNDLLEDPELIKRFSEVFVKQSNKLGDQPDHARRLLRQYVDAEFQLKAQFAPLRRYISSLAGIRWPNSLQPLLLLSEDAITRKFGDRAVSLYHALVSGDAAGVLTELGHGSDGRTLSRDEVRRLHDLEEDLYIETPEWRNNAAAVFAAISDRVADLDAGLLIAPLVRRLLDSKELRQRIGVASTGKIITKASGQEKADLAGRLVGDLLTPGKEIDFELPGGAKPNLDEAVQLVADAVDLVLSVRAEAQLAPSVDEQLMTWMQDRRVIVGGKEATLPVSRLEDWMGEHEAHFLPGMGGRYTAVIADQLISAGTSGLNTSDVVRRSRDVFDRLFAGDQSDREELWTQLAKYVQVNDRDIPALAWEVMGEHLTSAGDDATAKFVHSLADRLSREMNETKVWPLDWRAGAEALLSMLDQKLTQLANYPETMSAVETIIKDWGDVGDTTGYASRAVELLMRDDQALADQITGVWADKVVTELPETLAVWLAERFERLGDETKNSFVQRLREVSQRDVFNDDQKIRLDKLIQTLPDHAWTLEPFKSFATQLTAHVTARYSNPNEYLRRIWGVASYLVKHRVTGAGKMLTDVFINNVGNPSLFLFLFGGLDGCWMPSDGSGYNPDQIANHARKIVRQHPGDVNAGVALRSLRSMREQGITSVIEEQVLVETACLLWPHHRKAAVEVLETAAAIPDPARVAQLAEQLSLDDSEAVGDLRRVWRHIASLGDVVAAIQVAKELLQRPVRLTTAGEDLAVQAWFEVQQGKLAEVLQSVLTDRTLTSGQRKRAWLQTDQFRSQLGKEWLINVLGTVLNLEGISEATSHIFENRSGIMKWFLTEADRYDLAKQLLVVLVAAPSVEMKNRLVEWLGEINSEGALRELEGRTDLALGDLELLARVFPTSRRLKKLIKQSGSESSS